MWEKIRGKLSPHHQQVAHPLTQRKTSLLMLFVLLWSTLWYCISRWFDCKSSVVTESGIRKRCSACVCGTAVDSGRRENYEKEKPFSFLLLQTLFHSRKSLSEQIWAVAWSCFCLNFKALLRRYETKPISIDVAETIWKTVKI